jgi:hypothetical protein
MNSNPTSPSPEESASAANSSTNSPASEIRSEPVIHVPPHLIPPEDPTPPGYDIQYLPVDQHETLRAAQNIPPDFRVPWNWTDIILFAIFYFGITVVVGVILLGIDAGIAHRNLQDLAADKPVSAMVGIVAQAIGSALSLLYLWVLIHKRRGGRFWQAIGWRPLNQNPAERVRAWPFILAGIGLAVVALLADQFFPSKQNLPMEEMFQTRGALILLTVFGVLVAPFIEETIFRGFLYPVVGRSYGAAAAVVITGLIFGAYHAPQLWGGWPQIALIMIVGIVLTWARARQKSVLASFLIHISYNSAIFVVLVISTGGFRHIQP